MNDSLVTELNDHVPGKRTFIFKTFAFVFINMHRILISKLKRIYYKKHKLSWG
jgi:hypothetical protein